jgi:dynein heavy chain
MDTILIIQPRAAGGAGSRTPEQIVTDMAKEYSDMLPAQLDKSKAHATTFAVTDKGAMNSLGVFVGQEISRFNTLLAAMKSSLEDLVMAIAGTVVMSMELEQMFNKFLDAKVPDNWVKCAYPCLKPLSSWFKDMVKRIEFMSSWLYEGPPISFWVPGFFFPQGFMTASSQMYARETS